MAKSRENIIKTSAKHPYHALRPNTPARPGLSSLTSLSFPPPSNRGEIIIEEVDEDGNQYIKIARLKRKQSGQLSIEWSEWQLNNMTPSQYQQLKILFASYENESAFLDSREITDEQKIKLIDDISNTPLTEKNASNAKEWSFNALKTVFPRYQLHCEPFNLVATLQQLNKLISPKVEINKNQSEKYSHQTKIKNISVNKYHVKKDAKNLLGLQKLINMEFNYHSDRKFWVESSPLYNDIAKIVETINRLNHFYMWNGRAKANIIRQALYQTIDAAIDQGVQFSNIDHFIDYTPEGNHSNSIRMALFKPRIACSCAVPVSSKLFN